MRGSASPAAFNMRVSKPCVSVFRYHTVRLAGKLAITDCIVTTGTTRAGTRSPPSPQALAL